ncbi:MAG: hypothetical protein Q8M08_10285 [Bacteroidales bacterium]|nr:hypothetical protein [Bacteroidales bacterium]
MFNSSVLEVVIGLVFIYLLYSLLATIIQEILASTFSFRAKILERAISRMLEDENVPTPRINSILHLFKRTANAENSKSTTETFYHHPLIKFLGENKRHSKPSYITRETFSKVLIDLLRGDQVKPGDDIKPLIQKALDDNKTNWGGAEISAETLSYLKSIWADAQGDIEKFKELLGNWFDDTMDRASGWYKKNTQFILFFIGLALAITFNVDTIKIAGKLQKDPKLREQLVQQADAFIKAHPDLDQELASQKAELETIKSESTKNPDAATADSISKTQYLAASDVKKYDSLIARRDTLLNRAEALITRDIKNSNDLLGLGWKTYECIGCRWECYLMSLLGWVITALALSLGAPFWYDVLNKLMKVRNSVASSTSDDKQKQQDSNAPKIKRVG